MSKFTSLKGRILYKPYNIPGKSHVTHIGTEKDVVQVFINNLEIIHKLDFNSYVYFSKVCATTGEGCRVLNSSETLITEPSPVDENKIATFLNPPVSTLENVLTGPINRKVTVEGYLLEVGDVLLGESGYRRFLKFAEHLDQGVRPSIGIKLWGEQARIDIGPPSTLVCIYNVMLCEYNGNKELNSTPLTYIQVTEQMKSTTITIQGVSWNRTKTSLLSRHDDKIFYVETCVLEKIFKYGDMNIIGSRLTISSKGGKICDVLTEDKSKGDDDDDDDDDNDDDLLNLVY